MLKDLRSSAQKSDGLLTEDSPCEKRGRKREYCSKETPGPELPLPSKLPKNNRVGSKAEKRKEERNYFLDIETGKIGKLLKASSNSI